MTLPLFHALEEIGARILEAPHVLLFLDFDGTLAPLAPDPATARLTPSQTATLRMLNEHESVAVIVLGGRERADLQERVGVPGLVYAGNHGLEISGPGFVFIEPTSVECRAPLQALAADLKNRLQSIPGAVVEDKGLTLSIHYRQAPPEAAEPIRQAVHAALAQATHPFQLTTGDMVYEVRPRVNWSKGTAVAWIRDQLDQPEALAFYFGDDATDEDAFAALPNGITAKVGATPPETAAAYQLNHPDEAWRFLNWMVATLQNKKAAARGKR